MAKTCALIACIAFASNAALATEPVEHDADVLSACIGSAVHELERHAERRTRTAPDAVFVLPEGRRKDGWISDSQLGGDLDDADWDELREPIESMRRRADGAWTPPAQIAVALHTVTIGTPPAGEFGGYDDVFFAFWPPGYSSDAGAAIVRAMVGPSAHGGSLTCQLRKHRGTWIVVNHWLSFYA